MVWTGTEMIVGGGVGPNFLETGGRYNPARAEMVVHGGYNSDSLSGITAFLDDTWHYAPPRTMFLYLKP